MAGGLVAPRTTLRLPRAGHEGVPPGSQVEGPDLGQQQVPDDQVGEAPEDVHESGGQPFAGGCAKGLWKSDMRWTVARARGCSPATSFLPWKVGVSAEALDAIT